MKNKGKNCSRFGSKLVKSWAVTGTFHGALVDAKTEGEARRIFHRYYNGESIIHIRLENVLFMHL